MPLAIRAQRHFHRNDPGAQSQIDRRVLLDLKRYRLSLQLDLGDGIVPTDCCNFVCGCLASGKEFPRPYV